MATSARKDFSLRTFIAFFFAATVLVHFNTRPRASQMSPLACFFKWYSSPGTDLNVLSQCSIGHTSAAFRFALWTERMW